MMSSSEDRLQPTQQELDAATDKARAYWTRLAEEAITRHDSGTALEYVVPQDMLCRVPAMPSTQIEIDDAVNGSTGARFVMADASSTMRPVETGKCDVSEMTKISRGALVLGTQTPTSCKWSEAGFRQTQPLNYLGILSLAWSYILSVRLIETQQYQNAEVVYTNSTAVWQNSGVHNQHAPEETALEVDIGETDNHVARWWAAILAPNQGWRAVVTKRDSGIYLAPWSLSLEDKHRFRVVWRDDGRHPPETADCSPPPSQTALNILAEFCTLHNLGSQSLAAFGAALTFPTHNHYETPIQIPSPTNTECSMRRTSAKQYVSQLFAVGDDLPYYMALSCNYGVVMSSLCGSFWEPDIPCNLVSPWLHPVLEEIPERAEIAENTELQAEIIALICGMRRPRIFAFWIGAALSGLVPKIIGFVRRGTPPLDQNGFSWTGCPQSFMDVTGSGPYFHGDSSGELLMRRADAWRLLYLPGSEDDTIYYRSLPFSPWEPAGKTSQRNCDLRLQAHESCPRHRLAYVHWTWELPGGSTLTDQGFCSSDCGSPAKTPCAISRSDTVTAHPIIPLSQNQEASRNASMEIFRWELANQGKPPSEPIYDDEWLAECYYYSEGPELEENEADSDTGSVVDSTTQNVTAEQDLPAQDSRVREWMGGIF